MSAPDWMLPDFDPNSAKVARLRSILLENDVSHNATRKSDLVDVYEAQVRPKAKAELAKWNKTRPSANGIIDMDTGGQLVSSGAAAPTPKKRGRPRKSVATPAARRKGEEDDGSVADDDEDAMDVDEGAKKPTKASAKKTPGTGMRKSKSVARDLTQVQDSDGEDDEAVPKAAPKRPRGRPPKAQPAQTSTPAASTSKSPAKAITPAWIQDGGKDALAALDQHAQSMMRSDRSSGEKRKKPTAAKEETDGDEEEPKEKRRKSKAARRTSGFSSGGESGFSDVNPFQNQSATEDTPEKKPRRKSSLGSGIRQPSAVIPKSATAPNLRLDSPASRASTSGNAGRLLGTPDGRTLHPRASLPTKMMPSPPYARIPISAPQFAHPPPAVDTPDQVQKILVPDPDFGLELDAGEVASPAKRIMAPLTKKKRPSLAEIGAMASNSPKRALAKVRQQRKDGELSRVNYVALASLLLLLLGAGGWYRHEKAKLGFCDPGRTDNSLIRDVRDSEYLRFGYADDSFGGLALNLADNAGLRPSCMACPTHGNCEDTSFLGCDSDYVRKENLLSFGGLFPVAPRCVPDTEKLVKIAEEAAGVARVLRRKRGEIVCKGEWSGKGGAASEEARTYGLSKDDLRKLAASGRRSSYGDLFELALDDLEAHGEVVKGTDLRGNTYFASRTADMSLACQAKLAAIAWAKRQKMALGSIFFFLATAAWIKWKVQSAKSRDELVRELVKEVLEKLREQSSRHYVDNVTTVEPYMAPAHIRDLVLADEHSPPARKELWRGVEKVVEGNSNVRTRQAEHRGETIRVWEWIGNYQGAIDFTPRRSIGGSRSAPNSHKRVSFGDVETSEINESPSVYPALPR